MKETPQRGSAEQTPSRSRILIVEDSPDIAKGLRVYFDRANYEVDLAFSGHSGLIQVVKHPPDLIVLDWMLPDIDGLEFIQALREEQSIPIIMLTAKREEKDRVAGLELGADDYVTKPFSPRELLARVTSVLRRSEVTKRIAQVPVQHGPLVVNPVCRTAYLNRKALSLTTLEFNLLYTFMRASGRVFTRDELLRRVWGSDYLGEDRIVDVHIYNLRKKLEANPGAKALLTTVKGIGYQLKEADREY